MATPATTETPTPVQADLLAGVVLEARNLKATRAFYEPIFAHAVGEWRQGQSTLSFHSSGQSIEFVQRPRPRTLADSGQHQAYSIPSHRLPGLVQKLSDAGHEVVWWREDHPAERTCSAYLHDPNGNRVQLLASDNGGALLAHVAVEVHEFDYCEHVYVGALGGKIDYYHGWRIEDQEEARSWAEGDDPCAPWTRRDNPMWRDFLDAGTSDRNLRVPRPDTQLFISYGGPYVGLISATRVRQELPPQTIRATPRLVLRVAGPAIQTATTLARVLPLPFEQEGEAIFLRDPDGNFIELRCQGD